MSYKDKYSYWLNNNYFDEKTKEELKAIANDDNEIKERFYKDLEFGTGGLRGILGAGSNRLNIYVIRKATQGFASYILSQNYNGKDPKNMGVCIAYDSRNMSEEFAQEAALVFNANGIKTYIYNELKPTPQLSFSIRHLGCAGGIMVTASHNPKEYNGYKVYGEYGAQIPYPDDEKIINYVNEIENFSDIKIMDKDQAISKGLYNTLNESIDEEFTKCVLAQSINGDIIKEIAHDFKIVYTPLNGCGNKPVRNVLERAGFKNVFIVKEQELPDPNFTTVNYPNPEDPKAFELAIKLAKEINADIIIGTDPDADRLGAITKNSKGDYIPLNGNTIGILLAEYILSQKKLKGTLPKNSAIISSVVSTNMTEEIATAFNAKYFEVLTGFKYIGELIKNLEEEGTYKYVFAFEESHGYLVGDYARDKDGIGISMLMCEMAAFYKSKNMTLCEKLQEIYKTYGYHKETTHSITLKGIQGSQTIKEIMDFFTNSYPKEVKGVKLLEFKNYNNGTIKNLATNEEGRLLLGRSNMVYFTMENKSWFCIRPSGTEPKLKVYFGVKEATNQEAEAKLNFIKDAVLELINSKM